MGITKLGHYSVRTADMETSMRFYTEVMGFRAGFRPPFDFPGEWLYSGEDETDFGVVHLIGVDPHNAAELESYLGAREGKAMEGTGSLDHIAFLASDWPAMRKRCDAHGVAYTERTVPFLNLHQVFIVDPSGLTIELNFPTTEGWDQATLG